MGNVGTANVFGYPHVSLASTYKHGRSTMPTYTARRTAPMPRDADRATLARLARVRRTADLASFAALAVAGIAVADYVIRGGDMHAHALAGFTASWIGAVAWIVGNAAIILAAPAARAERIRAEYDNRR